jgi:hypothetical protein
VVPLRSNARTLVAGGSVAAMRKRLKYASLFYDSLLLESGIFRVQAGPTGSSSFIVPPTAEDPPRWQTVAERRAATGATFVVAVSPGGAPDSAPHAVVSSEAAISWTATLHPFAGELPPGTDWVHFVKSRDPAGKAKQLAQQWATADKRNLSLERAIPIRFVRETIIDSANHDRALAAMAGAAVTSDRFHSQVVALRFNDQQGWKLQGYAVPVLFPQIGDWPWPAIADLPRPTPLLRQPGAAHAQAAAAPGPSKLARQFTRGFHPLAQVHLAAQHHRVELLDRAHLLQREPP